MHPGQDRGKMKTQASPLLLQSERGRRLFSIEFEQANGIPIIETGSQINSMLSRGDPGASLKPAPAAPCGCPNKVPLTHQLIFQCLAPGDKEPSLLGGFHPCTPPPPLTPHVLPQSCLPNADWANSLSHDQVLSALENRRDHKSPSTERPQVSSWCSLNLSFSSLPRPPGKLPLSGSQRGQPQGVWRADASQRNLGTQ